MGVTACKINRSVPSQRGEGSLAVTSLSEAHHDLPDGLSLNGKPRLGSRRGHAPVARGSLLLAVASAVLLLAAVPGADALAGDALDLRPELSLPVALAPTDAAGQELTSADDVLLLAQTVVTQGQSTITKKKSETGETAKSPGKAFIFSAAVPGSGQLYAGAKRGYVYLGIEAVAWTTSYFFHKSGKQKEEDYMDFADAHWTEPTVGDSIGVSPDGGTTYYYTDDYHNRIVYFRENDKGHYYEDIGKYAYYQIGWDPGTLGEYLDMRDDSNRLLKNSSYAIMGAVVNHVVSAVDALRLARSHNLRLGYGIDLDLKLKGNLHSRSVMLVASRKF